MRRRSRSVALLLSLGLAAAVCATTKADADANAPAYPGASLREEAAKGGILIGSGAINPDYFDDPRFGQVLAEQFDSLSPENELKFGQVEPQQGVFDFSRLDQLVDFAAQHDMEVKGHGLISGCCNPDWLTEMTDSDQVRAALTDHFNTIMRRYDGKVDRWDVVTEAFSTFGGTGLEQNFWYQRLGPDYIAEAFRIAHAADPDAKLFFNESLVEYYPAKAQEMYALVSQMVEDGVPITGVGLEMHETTEGPPPGALTDLVSSYQALGLEVAITELDVHVYDSQQQAQIYRDVVTEALDAGVREISFWGSTDAHLYTWLPGAKPLMFDEEYNPKPAYFAVWTALNRFVDSEAPTITITTPAEGGTYLQNETVTVDYGCSDEAGGSGVASCEGVVPDGAELDTSGVGPSLFSVTGTDFSGNSATGTASYSIVSAQTALRSVVDKVRALVAVGALRASQAAALTNNLESAVKQLDKGNSTSAADQVTSSIALVRELVDDGHLSPGEGQALIYELERVLSTLR